jgi:hypothetical protein
VLGEPAFPVGLADGQAQGEFLEPDGVPGVLGVDAVDDFVVEVDVDALIIDIGADAVDESSGGVQDAEILLGITEGFELLVPGTVEEVLAVSDIEGVGHLDAGDGEDGAGGAEAEKADDHLAAGHAVFEVAADLGETFFAVGRVDVLSEVEAGLEEVLGDLLVASLVVGTVEMTRMARGDEGFLLGGLDGLGADVADVLRGVARDEDGGGPAELDGVGDEAVELGVRLVVVGEVVAENLAGAIVHGIALKNWGQKRKPAAFSRAAGTFPGRSRKSGPPVHLPCAGD